MEKQFRNLAICFSKYSGRNTIIMSSSAQAQQALIAAMQLVNKKLI